MEDFMPAKSNPILKPTSRRLKLIKWLGTLGFLSLAAVSAGHGQNATAAKPEAVPGDALSGAAVGKASGPSAALAIVEIYPFNLGTGYRYNWLASQPDVTSGLLVVLKVDPEYVVPQNAAEPVLYAGDRTVQRLNQGDRSGYVIGIIPGEVDLATAPIWFGRPELPERVTPEIIAEERALAERAGIGAFSPDEIERALRGALEAEDLSELLRGPVADLVLKYSPDEKGLAETWRLPSTGSADPR
jgi:hypothetical protein